MTEKFKTILTKKGLEILAEATATGLPLDLYQIAVGDGNGSYYEPTEEQVKLINEVGRFELNALMVEADNKKRFSAEVLIPESSGGYTIREAGLFDKAGELIAVAKVPETFKPSVESGAGSQLYFKMIGEYTNDVNLTISINPRGLFVTDDVMRNYIASDVIPVIEKGDEDTLSEAKDYADEKTNAIDSSLSKHISNKSNPHSVTKAQVGLGNVDNTADSSKSVNYANSSGASNISNGLWGYTGSNIGKSVDSSTYFAVMNGSQGGASGGWANINSIPVNSAIQNALNGKPNTPNGNFAVANMTTFTLPAGGTWFYFMLNLTYSPSIDGSMGGYYFQGSIICGIAAGGFRLGTNLSGFAWRIA